MNLTPERREARRLRAEGMAIRDIADRMGRRYSTIGTWVRGVECPVNHRGLHGLENLASHCQARRANAAPLREEMRRLRATGLSLNAIGLIVGRSKAQVTRSCVGVLPKGAIGRAVPADLPLMPKPATPAPVPAVPVPDWVPDFFRTDYRRIGRLYGEEKAASEARIAKREAAAACP